MAVTTASSNMETVAHSRKNRLSLSPGDNRSPHRKTALYAQPVTKQAKTLAITSGKGGVGKSNITINLAISLAQKGARVCIFDADTSMANVNILMGLHPKYTIEHLLNGAKTLEEIMLEGPANVRIIPAASGLATLSDLDDRQQTLLINALEKLEKQFDYLLIDTPAGIGKNVTRFLRSAHSILLVITTEPTSLTDAFALLRVLKRSGYKQTTHVLVNMAINHGNSMEVFKRFQGAVHKYLGLSLKFSGYITDDVAVKEAVRHQCPVVLYRPDALATRCFKTLGKVLENRLAGNSRLNKFSTFWKMLLTSGKDDVQASAVAKLLSSRPLTAAERQKYILNYINASNLDNKDLLSIINILTSVLSKNEKTITGKEDKARLNLIIQTLQSIDSGNTARVAIDDLEDSAIRMSSAGLELERLLDLLNKEMSKHLG